MEHDHISLHVCILIYIPIHFLNYNFSVHIPYSYSINNFASFEHTYSYTRTIPKQYQIQKLSFTRYTPTRHGLY